MTAAGGGGGEPAGADAEAVEDVGGSVPTAAAGGGGGGEPARADAEAVEDVGGSVPTAAAGGGEEAWDDDPQLVRAAGGVVWRAGDGGTEVLLVHRPRYDDWSLPKGKLDAGETHEGAATREVLEETGYEVELGRELASTRYPDARGRKKAVRYWAMTVTGGSFVANHETDEVRWLPVLDARARLTYEHDIDVLDSFVERRAG